ncbi:hypothetical protein AT959_17370 [Dechloromonas denitrificans]|uniref:FecR protein domain-containing protein n=1 Tax=Dechloromonas denitrificans TaxID=281362 RepID=A0A133XFG4_9RHOO|nr:DUF6600 domain-containing protein [Dechloromonas denitrificans]KXB29700.1 hypothetical protein AT959_17370 [Dechloromonas denitrificans]
MFRSMRFILAWLAVFGTALAQADPPARVGRLALVENEVNFRVDRSDAGGPASINWPISSGAEVDTERRGRAEIWIGATAFRLAGSSELRFPVVDDRQISAQLLRGTLTVSILEREQSDEVTVQTPEGRVSFAGPGRYRIDVQGDHSELTSQAGRASFDDGERRQLVEAGEKASFYGGGRMQIENYEGPDAFDRWVAARENAALAKAGPRHVSPAMTGYQDLDAYGDWQSQPDYGAVWYPRAVADDWAPYRFGRWVWIAPWGWTWVDRAPWGFAPFHYGRWVQVRGRWGWVPGSYVARPVYAPALVAWIGNPGWSVSFSFGSAPAVGWFPLAPREVYIPGFRASPTYVRQINVTHIHDVTIIDRAVRNGPPRAYAYRDQPRAVTVVPARNFREGRPITPRELGRHDQRELARAPQARAVPDSTWLPRPTHEERREVPGGRANEGRPSRDGAPLMRPPANERLPDGRRDDPQRMEMQQREAQQRQEMQRRDAEQQEARHRDQQRTEMQQREAQQKQEMQRRDAEQQEGRRRDQQRIEMQQREVQQKQEMQRRDAEQQEGRRRDQQRIEMQQREAQQKQEIQRREVEQQEGRRRDQERIEMQQREAQQKQEMQRRDAEQQEGRRRDQERIEMQQREAQQKQEIQRRDVEQQEGRRREQQRMEMQQREAQQRQEIQRRDAEQQEGRRRDQQRMEMQQREAQQKQEMQRQEAQQQEARRRDQQRMEAQQRETQQRQEQRPPESRGGNREGGERGPR